MRLKAGDRAVPFSAETLEGRNISLDQFAGKPLLLMFYRYASCPMCNLRLRDFAQKYPALHERGLEVVAFFHSPARNIRANAGETTVPLSSGRRSAVQGLPQLWGGDFVVEVPALDAAAKLLCGLGALDALRLLGRRGLADGQNAGGLSGRPRWSHPEGALWTRDRRPLARGGGGGRVE